MPVFPKKWLAPTIAVAFLWPLLRPVLPDVVSDYRLFLVSTMIIAAIAVPGLLKARQSGNEAVAIGSVRTVDSAEATYAASCGWGGYAQLLADLALAPNGSVPFISADLGAGLKSGYNVALGAPVANSTVTAAANTCNGAAANATGSRARAERAVFGRLFFCTCYAHIVLTEKTMCV